jgi:hypothetical protein
MADRLPDLFSYIVETDSGFCPNPYGDICTIACCKPRIRHNASVGDWIIGTTSSPIKTRLVYAMQVSRALTYELYWSYPEYECKKPNKNNLRGDNIYRNGENCALIQIPNQCHSEKHFKTDTSVNRVLISKNFYYFGKESPEIPEQYRAIIHIGQGHSQIKPISKNSMAVSVFLIWLRDNFKQGVHGEPTQVNVPKKLSAASTRKKLKDEGLSNW